MEERQESRSLLQLRPHGFEARGYFRTAFVRRAKRENEPRLQCGPPGSKAVGLLSQFYSNLCVRNFKKVGAGPQTVLQCGPRVRSRGYNAIARFILRWDEDLFNEANGFEKAVGISRL